MSCFSLDFGWVGVSLGFVTSVAFGAIFGEIGSDSGGVRGVGGVGGVGAEITGGVSSGSGAGVQAPAQLLIRTTPKLQSMRAIAHRIAQPNSVEAENPGARMANLSKWSGQR